MFNAQGEYKGNGSPEPILQEFLIWSSNCTNLNLDPVYLNEMRKQEI